MSEQFNIKRAVGLSIGFFILFWMGDTLIDLAFFFDVGSLKEALFSPEPRELYMRTTSSFLLALVFLLVSVFSHKTRRAELSLKDSHALAGVFFDSTRHAICIVDADDFTISQANRTFLQRFALKESRRTSLPELAGEHRIPGTVVEQLRQCVTSGRPISNEISYIGQDGRKIYEEISTLPVGEQEEGTKRVLYVMRDVTVRRTSEALLLESEARYRAIFENTGTAMAIVLPDGMLHMVNRGFETITGYASQELEGKRGWAEFVAAADRDALPPSPCLEKSPAQQSIELHIVDRLGNARAMVGNWAAIEGTDKTVLSLVDISAQKRVEEALRESRAALSAAQRIAHVGNWEWDLGADAVTWSDEMYRIFDVDQEGFTPSHDWVLQSVHPDDRAKVIRSVNDAIYDHKAYDLEFRIVLPGGVVRTVAARGEVTYDAKGTPLRMVGTNQDITWRIEAEQALRRSEEKFSKAFRASPDCIVITRAEDGTYIDVNQAFQEVTGYSREEVIGKSSTELGLWLDPEARMAMLRLMNEHGHVHNLDVKFRIRSGEIRELLWSAEIIEYWGEACLIAIYRDVTEQRHLEKELLESDARLYMKHEELRNLFHQMEGIRREWEATMDCISDLFILADHAGKIRRFNRAVEIFSGKAHRDIVGREWSEFLVEHGLKRHLETPGVELLHEASGKWLVLKRYSFPAVDVDGATREVIIINDTTGIGLRCVSTAPEPASGLRVVN